MQRVAVLGCGGSGKTMLARAIAQAHGLPLVDVDALGVEDGRELPVAELWARHDEAIERDAWVVDAMRLNLLERRLERADTAVFLDLPRRACLLGLLQRRLRGGGAGVPGRLDREFLRWVWGFPRTTRPAVLKVLARHADTTEVVILRSRRAARAYMAGLPAGRSTRRVDSAAPAEAA